MRNIKLVVAYDGTDFKGWQTTDTGKTIEGSLQEVLDKLLNERVSLQAASRTDSGVHASGQVVNFFTTRLLHPAQLKRALNALLPKTIAILEAEEVALSFHPTLDAIGKEYIYQLHYGEVLLPSDLRNIWHIGAHKILHLAEMKRACSLFIGRHNFSAFCNQRKNISYIDKIREIYTLEIKTIETEKKMKITISGNHFLYKMVRNIVGTLVYVGQGKMSVTQIEKLIESGTRQQGAITAPALGLTLTKIFYPERCE